jgi:predicted AAA+ superfamily ATPase
MQRDAYQQLQAWKKAGRRKPLLLQGARQVGKTFLLKAFGKAEYQNCSYINFEEQPNAKKLFEGNIEPNRILRDLNLYLDQPINPHTTLLIFDEIQECPNALTSLKYFNEQANEYHIAAAGSLLGVKLSQAKGFPVGKVNFLTLYPLTFFEFLNAIGKTKLREFLESITTFEPIAEPLHEQLLDLLRIYTFVGGMPEAVNYYVKDENLLEIRTIQNEILKAYLHDFAKHAPTSDIMKLTTIWESIPGQLAKENKKFIFSIISKQARAREYENAIQWLSDAGLILKSYLIETPRLPLESYCDKKSFKLFMLDVGLLGAMCQLPSKVLLQGNELFTEFKGALTENLVAQALTVKYHRELYYWGKANQAEVDFLIHTDSHILPLEVKAGFSKKKKSLQIYAEKYHPAVMARTSLMNLKKDGDLFNYPLYMMERFPLE